MPDAGHRCQTQDRQHSERSEVATVLILLYLAVRSNLVPRKALSRPPDRRTAGHRRRIPPDSPSTGSPVLFLLSMKAATTNNYCCQCPSFLSWA